MSIDEAVLELKWLKEINQEILETDDADSAWAKPWIKHCESVTQALDITIDTARKYQMMQDHYEARLKADMVAMLTEIQLEIEESEPLCNECDYAIDDCTSKAKVNDIIQQKINGLKENKDGSNTK